MNSKKTVKSLENSLQASGIGTNKYLINVNGGDAQVKTNQNSRILYNLQEPIKLDVGDKVTLYKAFLNERGLTDSTISFDEEVSNEIRFLYYKLGDLEDVAEGSGDISYAPYPKVWTDCFIGGQNGPVGSTASVFAPNNLIPVALTGRASNVTVRESGYMSNPHTLDFQRLAGDDLTPNMPDAGTPQSSNRSSGANGKMFYLMEGCRLAQDPHNGTDPNAGGSSFTYGKFWNQSWNNGSGSVSYNPPAKLKILGGRPLMRPVYGKAKIVVPKGNYGVDSLASIVMNQLNGSIGEPGSKTQMQSDALIDKLYRPDISKIGATAKTLPFFKDLVNNRIETDADIYVHDNIFWKATSTRKNGGIMCELNVPNTAFYECISYDNMVNNDYTLSGNPTNSGNADNENFFINQPPNGWTQAGKPSGSQGGILVNQPFDNAEGANNFRGTVGLQYSKKPGLYNFYRAGTDENGGINLVGTATDRSLVGETNNFYISNGFLDTWINRSASSNIIDLGLRTSGRIEASGGIRLFENTQGSKGFVGAEPPPNSGNVGDASVIEDNNYIFMEDDMYLRMLFPVYGMKKPTMIVDSDTGVPYPDASRATTECGIPADGAFRQIFGGTSDFTLKYDSTNADRFALSNFHDFYKLPSYDGSGNNTGHGGTQATKYNNPYGQTTKIDYPALGGNSTVEWSSGTSAVYPIDGQTGIMINNFAYDVCKNTQVWKDQRDLILSQQDFGDRNDGQNYGGNAMKREKDIFDLFTKPFDQFFQSPTAAKKAWETTLWARLGFTYSQLGDITSQLESRMTGGSPLYERSLKLFGIVTHNQFDFTSIAASQGLGHQHFENPASSDNNPKQKYTLESYYQGKCNGVKFQNIGAPFVLLESSKEIAAETLPNLSGGQNYYIIESDIVKPNYENSVGTKGTVVGIMTKENSTADTLYSTEGIDFIITEEKLLTEINIDVKNPDGTRVPDQILGEDNGFIFIVEKPIPVETMGTNSF